MEQRWLKEEEQKIQPTATLGAIQTKLKEKNVKIKTCGKTILRLPSISRRPAFLFFSPKEE